MDLLKREDWIEVDRRKVIAVNGTLYSRVPEYLKRAGIKAGDRLCISGQRVFRTRLSSTIRKVTHPAQIEHERVHTTYGQSSASQYKPAGQPTSDVGGSVRAN